MQEEGYDYDILVGSLLTTDIDKWFTDKNLQRIAKVREDRASWMRLYMAAKHARMEGELVSQLEEIENMARMTDVVHWLDLPDLPDDAWLVDQLVRKGSLSIIAGDPKAGKSTLITHMIACILQGRGFIDRVASPARCLYYSLEEIGAEVKARFANYGITNEPLYVREGYVPPSSFTHILTEDIEKYDIDFVLIDPLFDIVEVESANDYVPVNRAIKQLLYVARNTGAHVCCIHHAAKHGGILGAQSLRAGTDFNFFMIKDDKTGERWCYSENRYGDELAKYIVRLRANGTLAFDPKDV